MKFVKSFLILIALSSIFASCRRPPDPNSFYFMAKLNGQAYVPNNCANCLNAQLLGDTTFLFNANAGFESIAMGFRDSLNVRVKDYFLDGIKGLASYDNNPSVNDIFKTDAAHIGQLNITTLDKVNKIVAGTFYFQAYNPVQNATVNITDGSFRLQYQE